MTFNGVFSLPVSSIVTRFAPQFKSSLLIFFSNISGWIKLKSMQVRRERRKLWRRCVNYFELFCLFPNHHIIFYCINALCLTAATAPPLPLPFTYIYTLLLSFFYFQFFGISLLLEFWGVVEHCCNKKSASNKNLLNRTPLYVHVHITTTIIIIMCLGRLFLFFHTYEQ